MGLISRVSSRTYRSSNKNSIQKKSCQSNMPLAIDLLHPSMTAEKARHKKKRLVQSPNSFFMDVKCQGCFKIKTVFSHAQTVVVCPGCNVIMSQPTGGKARLTTGCSFRKKANK